MWQLVRTRRFWITVVLAVLGAVLLWRREWLLLLWQLYSVDSMTQVADYLRSFGIWTPMVSLLLMVAQTVVAPLPGSLIAAANGIVFGIWWGTLLSWVGGLMGASLAFGIARWLGRNAVTRLLGPAQLDAANQFGQREGFWVVLVARLIPLVSFDLISYLVGLSTMSYRRFLLATAIGMLPGTFAWTALGHDLALAETSTWRISLIALIFIGGIIGGRWSLRRARRRVSLDER
ncbi:MAG: TVP38/TMEM64 family protein [Roseiflexaceae bacterium]|nr:TVP38/TMEM64 family protein [Roseiflexaceae bacterium]